MNITEILLLYSNCKNLILLEEVPIESRKIYKDYIKGLSDWWLCYSIDN